jgi:RNA polymerase sigma-70 factor, ECF subfamily
VEIIFVPVGQTSEDAVFVELSGVTGILQPCWNMTGPSFESVVEEYYQPLYKFAFSLTRAEADACDLTQQTFYVWATKGYQVRDPSKTKTWLFTTLHRTFLQRRRKEVRFPHHELTESDTSLPVVDPVTAEGLDGAQVLEALNQIDDHYQAAVALFYLEDCSYKEIAEMLDVPIGTVKSRLTRGLGQLREILSSSSGSSGIGKARP